jgi:DNA-binding MarR family transcriptional regulator
MKDRKPQIQELIDGMDAMRRKLIHPTIVKMNMPQVSRSQGIVLMCMSQENPLSIKELAEKLQMTSSAASQLVDGLVKNGYVERKESAEDRRVVVLTLSKDTRKQVEKMKEQLNKKFLEMFAVLTDKEFDQHYALQKKILQKFLIQKQ